jgi:hypothetical protein
MPDDMCSAYHDYSIEWTQTYVAWAIDGQEIRRDTGATAQAFVEAAGTGMAVHFNIWPGNADFGGNFSPGILPVQQYISWVQYSAYANGSFELQWREEFEGTNLPSDWAVGNWASPFNLSTHNAANASFVNGIAVLSLTADDATGFTGVPPVDDGGGSAGSGGMGAAGGGVGGIGGGTGGGGTGGTGAEAGGAAGRGGGPAGTTSGGTSGAPSGNGGGSVAGGASAATSGTGGNSGASAGGSGNSDGVGGVPFDGGANVGGSATGGPAPGAANRSEPGCSCRVTGSGQDRAGRGLAGVIGLLLALRLLVFPRPRRLQGVGALAWPLSVVRSATRR